MAENAVKKEVTPELLEEVEAGLVGDRRTLLRKLPFIGSILMHLDLEVRTGLPCETAATDGSRIMFDPFFYQKLTEGERLFVLAHEAWHCALLHFARTTKEMHHQVANIAQDLEIHFVLMDELEAQGMEEPFVLPHDPAWKGLAFEEIYKKLIDSKGNSDGCSEGRESNGLKRRGQEGFDGPCQKGASEGQDEQEEISDAEMRRRVERMREAVAQAAVAAQRKQGKLPGYLQGVVDKILKPQMNWKMLLRRYVTSAYGGSRRWLPPSRRHVWQGLYLQSMRDDRLQACVAVDTSGSCVGDLPQFFGELSALLGSFGNYEITVIQCDTRVGRVDVFTSDRPLPKNYGWTITGGGGTSFVPVFDYIKSQGLRPDVFVYVTDGYGDAPAQPPPYPVLWVLTADGTEDFVSWGSKLHLNAAR